MASKPNPIAIIAGVGPGTGAAVARKFSRSYPVALLARSSSSYESLVSEINGAGGKAVGVSADVSDEASMKAAQQKINEAFGSSGEVSAAAAVFNASGKFSRKPFLESSLGEWTGGLDVGG